MRMWRIIVSHAQSSNLRRRRVNIVYSLCPLCSCTYIRWYGSMERIERQVHVSTKKNYILLGEFIFRREKNEKHLHITWNYHRWRFIWVVNLNSCYVLFAWKLHAEVVVELKHTLTRISTSADHLTQKYTVLWLNKLHCYYSHKNL